jgi:hypothetical protein
MPLSSTLYFAQSGMIASLWIAAVYAPPNSGKPSVKPSGTRRSAYQRGDALGAFRHSTIGTALQYITLWL